MKGAENLHLYPTKAVQVKAIQFYALWIKSLLAKYFK